MLQRIRMAHMYSKISNDCLHVFLFFLFQYTCTTCPSIHVIVVSWQWKGTMSHFPNVNVRIDTIIPAHYCLPFPSLDLLPEDLRLDFFLALASSSSKSSFFPGDLLSSFFFSFFPMLSLLPPLSFFLGSPSSSSSKHKQCMS